MCSNAKKNRRGVVSCGVCGTWNSVKCMCDCTGFAMSGEKCYQESDTKCAVNTYIGGGYTSYWDDGTGGWDGEPIEYVV